MFAEFSTPDLDIIDISATEILKILTGVPLNEIYQSSCTINTYFCIEILKAKIWRGPEKGNELCDVASSAVF
jgi:hypothetical protein